MQVPDNKLMPRVLTISGAVNFRDLGGYQTPDGRHVKWGKVFRSAQLDRLTDQGIKELKALDVKVVVDLRFSEESVKSPTVKAAVPNAEMLSWHDEFQDDSESRSSAMKRSWRDSLETNDPAQVREAMRVNYPQKLYSHRAIYKKMLLRLVQGQVPLVFHCAAGKDRTGVAAALILSLLGVSNEQIVEDYLLTQNEIKHLMDSWVAGGATSEGEYEDFQQRLMRQPRELIQPVFDADVNYIKTLLDYVDSEYQGFENYTTRNLEMSSSDINALRLNLLE